MQEVFGRCPLTGLASSFDHCFNCSGCDQENLASLFEPEDEPVSIPPDVLAGIRADIEEIPYREIGQKSLVR